MMVTRFLDRNGPRGRVNQVQCCQPPRIGSPVICESSCFNHIYRDHDNVAQVEKMDSTSRRKLENDLHHLGLARCEQILGTAQSQPTRRCSRRQTWRRAEHPPCYDKHANTGTSPCHQINPTRHPCALYLAAD